MPGCTKSSAETCPSVISYLTKDGVPIAIDCRHCQTANIVRLPACCAMYIIVHTCNSKNRLAIYCLHAVGKATPSKTFLLPMYAKDHPLFQLCLDLPKNLSLDASCAGRWLAAACVGGRVLPQEVLSSRRHPHAQSWHSVCCQAEVGNLDVSFFM